MSKQNQAPQADMPINISPRDWRRLPAFYKSVIDGIPRVLTKRGTHAEFVPVRFVYPSMF